MAISVLPSTSLSYDVSITQHGLAPKAPNDVTKFLDGTGAFSTPSPSSPGTGWTTIVKKSADQTRTNDATLTNDTELFITMGTGELWYFQLILLYSGNDANGDLKGNFTFPASHAIGRSITAGQADAITVVNHIGLDTATIFTANWISGVNGTNTVNRTANIEAWVWTTASGNFQFQFALQSAAAGRTAICKAGSTLRGIKLA